ncbi:protein DETOXIFICATION 45, chloroplastic-like isoform X1 [Carya illinoinensis]|uniref:protein DETOXIFICATION 45, chloroplastic-like isoform X1 n=1 Tax=Carya illinoinensis TaxID=32201 RepID=UPI001C719044|nr:protein DETOXIFICATION 45, chloroplastic-like isoform X1 [Carya illinoinensis]XP_042982598.1 protein DETOXIFICATION 45, chloroplastic-like isoform X1 [Carya illinoinensis]
MTVTGLSGSITCNISINRCGSRSIKNGAYKFGSNTSKKGRYDRCFAPCDPRGLSFNNVARRCGLISEQQTSDYELSSSSVEDSVASKNGALLSEKIFEIAGTPTRSQSPSSNVQTELIMLSLPAIAGQAIEPLAQLMETAYIGRLGPLEMASAGLSMSIFNIISKVFNIPLLSVATSFVAEDISQNATKGSNSGTDGMSERKQLPSVSTALLLAVVIGTFEALAMYLGSGVFLSMMGISSASSMRIPAEQFLSLRAIGAPAVVVSLAIQGIFRGFKDTKTPVLCLGLGNLSAVFLFPFLMYFLRLGVVGAAISTVVSQYIVTFFMIWFLNKRTVLSLPSMRSLHFGGYLRSGECFLLRELVLVHRVMLQSILSGGFLLGRTLAAVLTITLSTSMAARLGPLSMAAHQICLQVWLSVSLLADAQASSGQALIASSFARGDFSTVKEIAYFALKTGLFTGVSLAIILGVSFGSLATLFTNDSEVLEIVRSGLLFVSASQPLNALAYIFDGLHYGISDFSYAACSMMVVGAISCAFLLYAPSMIGLSGVWLGLVLFMGLRTVAGYVRLLSKNGPWWFLQQDVQKFEIAT